MKPVLAAAGGFFVSLGMFAGGVLATASYLSAEPVGPGLDASAVSSAWTAQAQRIDVASQDFERLPAATQPYDHDTADAPRDRGSVDTFETASLQIIEAEPDVSEEPQMSAAHLAWCSDRFRSYRASDNTYQPYSGGRQPCVSPHLDGTTALNDQAPDDQDFAEEQYASSEGMLHYASDTQTTAAGASDHISDCFSRYRSYRVSDNSYQPYDGGPRRQCE